MGRGKNRKKIEVVPDYDWPFEISIKLNRNPPKVCFLSGVPRDYYPDDPGFSKFGLTYCLPFPDDTATPNYVPSEDRLQKPVSLLGYGIGGLSAPRFAPLLNQDNPAPNIYQSELVPPRVKKSEKLKRIQWKDFVKYYEDIVEKQCAKYYGEQPSPGETKKSHAASVWSSKSVEKINDHHPKAPQHKHHHHHSAKVQGVDRKVHIKSCKRKFSAFGMGFANDRFPKEKSDEGIGVGTYSVNSPPMKQSFHITNPEGTLVPRVRVVCHPGGNDVCMTCGLDLFKSDYYQTINKFKVQLKDQEGEGKSRMRHLALCRSCYCLALKNGCSPWSKEKIPRTFMKARHCNSVHDHKEGHPEFLFKSTCKGMLNLARRELMYSRYFKDTPCEKGR